MDTETLRDIVAKDDFERFKKFITGVNTQMALYTLRELGAWKYVVYVFMSTYEFGQFLLTTTSEQMDQIHIWLLKEWHESYQKQLCWSMMRCLFIELWWLQLHKRPMLMNRNIHQYITSGVNDPRYFSGRFFVCTVIGTPLDNHKEGDLSKHLEHVLEGLRQEHPEYPLSQLFNTVQFVEKGQTMSGMFIKLLPNRFWGSPLPHEGVFGMIVLVCDEYLGVTQNTPRNIKRFFNIASQLPLDVQMVLANRLVGLTKNIINGQYMDPVYRWLLVPDEKSE
jgi:hypothetical protein